MVYCNYSLGSDEKTAVLLLKDSGTILNVFIEERFCKSRFYSGFPYHSFDIIAKQNFKDICINSSDNVINNTLIKFIPNIKFCDFLITDKYLLKCYESFYTSGYNRAAVLVINGISDFNINEPNIILIHKFKKETNVIKTLDNNAMLVKYYIDALNFLKFDKNNEETFIDFSTKGNPFEKRYIKFVNNEIVCDYDINEWNNSFMNNDGVYDSIKCIDFAATVERDISECILEIVKYIKKLTGEDRICLAGGMFNNLIVNEKICESKIFSFIHCFPSPGNIFRAVGNSYYIYEKQNMKFQNLPIQHDYFGKRYSDERVLEYFNHYSINYKIVSLDDIYKLLSNNLVIWFYGNANIGKYSGIHRAILCNPLDVINKNKLLNTEYQFKILPCIIPNELYTKVLNADNIDLLNFNMRLTYIKNEYINIMDGAISNDLKGKPCLINRNTDPELYEIINKFNNEINIPFLLYDILYSNSYTKIENLSDCFKYFQDNNIDNLIINGKYLINKNNYSEIFFDKVYEYNYEGKIYD